MSRDIRIRLSEPAFLGNEEAYVAEAMRARQLSRGPFADRLEREFAALCGRAHAVAVSSGTAALHAALTAAGAGPGKAVAVPALTYIATPNAVRYTGARPVFVDVRPDTWTIDWALVPRDCTGAVPVDLYGVFAGNGGAGLGIDVRDSAEAAGGTVGGSPMGAFGQMAAFSLYGNKALAAGEGGVVVGDNRQLMERVRLVAGVGQGPERYVHLILGYSYRIGELAAAVGLAQCEQAARHFELRAALEARYLDRLQGIHGIGFQHRPAGSAPWVFPVLVPDQRRAAESLALAGVETRPVFPAMSRQPIYQYDCGRFPVAEHLSRHGILLPLHASMTTRDVDYVCNALLAGLGAREEAAS
jgi:perosamine synthetase